MHVIILAAGFSSRMGRLKQVLPLAGTPMIRQVVATYLQAGCEPVVVVGYQAEQVKTALHGLNCQFAFNARPADGMFRSVKLGALAIPDGAAGLLTPCDCPGVRGATIQQIQQQLELTRDLVVIPTFAGRRGHPVGLPAQLVATLRQLPDDTPGLHSLWRARPEMICAVAVDDAAVLHDFDTPADLPNDKDCS